jgi:hypothetical protein
MNQNNNYYYHQKLILLLEPYETEYYNKNCKILLKLLISCREHFFTTLNIFATNSRSRNVLGSLYCLWDTVNNSFSCFRMA